MSRSENPKKRTTERELNLFGVWFEFLQAYVHLEQYEIQRNAGLGQGTISKAIYEDGSIPKKDTLERLWGAFEGAAFEQGLPLPPAWKIAFWHAAGISTEQDQQASSTLLWHLVRREGASNSDT